MKDKLLPWFLLFCALGLSGTAAYYSVVGLSVVFVGVALPVIVMGGFLEISKIAIATYLHDKWKETYGVLKIYMTIALITLSLITSLGIYGLLSTGFSSNIAKLEIGQKEIKNIEVKKQRFEEIKEENQKEKQTLDNDISKLREALSNNTTTQSVDRQTGQLITRANNANRRSFETQLTMAIENRDKMSVKIDALNDSITKLDIEILDKQSTEISGNELGTIKYISELTGWGVKKTANIFILILIFVFDPLAITLVIATNQAFKSNKKEKETTPEPTPEPIVQVLPIFPKNTPQPTPQIIVEESTNVEEEPVIEENPNQSEEEIEENPNQSEQVTSFDSLFDGERYFDLFDMEDTKEEIVEENIEPQVEEENKPEEPQRELKKLSYVNRNGNGSGIQFNRF